MTSRVDTKIYSDGDTFDLLAIFHGGWYGEKPNCSVSGIGNDFERARKYAGEGTIIVDGSQLDYGVVVDLSIKGPVRDLNLPPNFYWCMGKHLAQIDRGASMICIPGEALQTNDPRWLDDPPREERPARPALLGLTQKARVDFDDLQHILGKLKGNDLAKKYLGRMLQYADQLLRDAEHQKRNPRDQALAAVTYGGQTFTFFRLAEKGGNK